jgi:diaminohydroxyphosphoribosylaminopyrimidine deaminase/5-amino-6-(5-phosphoribosylamino)uracil reductase
MTHDDYFKRAIALALRGRGKTSPNPLVGAVIVKKDRIIAEGWHRRCGGDHAEIAALKKAGARTRGAALYLTLEPCAHYGRTPPCVDQIIQSGIKTVYIGMKDPNLLTNGKSVRKLKRAGIRTEVGFMTAQIKRMNEPFIKYVKKKMPFVTAKCAQTLDGKVATASGRSKWITARKTRGYAHRLRNDFDAIVVGINTVLKDDPRLNAADKAKSIKKIIVDSSLKMPQKARLLRQTDPANIIIAVTRKADKKKIRRLTQKGISVLVAPQRSGGVDLRWLFKELARREITNVLIEGGPHLIASALQDNLIDKFFIFIAPRLMGDQEALSAVSGLKTRHLRQTVKLHDLKITTLGEDILIEGYVYRDR